MTLLSAEIKQLRADLGMGYEEFGRLMGQSYQTVRKWELGKAKPANPAAIMALIREIRKGRGI